MESDAGNDDWVTDHDDMKEADTDQFTEGTDYIYLPYAGRIELLSNFKVEMIDFFDGAAESIGIGEGHFLWKCRGRYGGTSEATRQAKMGNLMEFFKRHAKAIQNDIYLGYRKPGGNWEPFKDDSYGTKYYMKGRIALVNYWRQGRENYYTWKLVFQEGW
jgi:hypothetical protein